MEVEFLSNMRYTLYASEAEWKAWHVKLGKFWKYFENASKTPIESRTFGSLQSPHRPPALPSPPASTHTSPPFRTNYTLATTNSTSSHPLSMPPYLPPTVPSPVSTLPDNGFKSTARKRSHDHSIEDFGPPPKRFVSSNVSSAQSSTTMSQSSLASLTPGMAASSASMASASSRPRLPMPNLSISTGKQFDGRQAFTPTHLSMPLTSSKPPALPGMNRWPQNGMLPSLHQTVTPGLFPAENISPLSERTSRQASFASASASPSPTSFSFPQSAHTPNHLSPASFPFPRSSPYKPLRNVHTLLVPPPSASMHNPPQNLGNGQMHYQPLGKPISHQRPGVLPTLPHDSWSQPHNTPLYLPQPRVFN